MERLCGLAPSNILHRRGASGVVQECESDRGVGAGRGRVKLVCAGPDILETSPAGQRSAARSVLNGKGVTIVTNAAVTVKTSQPPFLTTFFDTRLCVPVHMLREGARGAGAPPRARTGPVACLKRRRRLDDKWLCVLDVAAGVSAQAVQARLQVASIERVGKAPPEGVPDTSPRMVYLTMPHGSRQAPLSFMSCLHLPKLLSSGLISSPVISASVCS